MSEEEIIAALSIEIEECGNMCSDWIEIRLLWKGKVISTAKTVEKSFESN